MADVPARDRWGTPPGVWICPLHWLGRNIYDLDAAAEEGRHVGCVRYMSAEDDALHNDWPMPERSGVLAPLAWLNPPFSRHSGGKAAWIEQARRQAARGWIVALYLPCYADVEVALLPTIARWSVMMVGRVAHVPPPGIAASHPDRHAHAIHLLAPPSLYVPQPPSPCWDWRSVRWASAPPLTTKEPT